MSKIKLEEKIKSARRYMGGNLDEFYTLSEALCSGIKDGELFVHLPVVPREKRQVILVRENRGHVWNGDSRPNSIKWASENSDRVLRT
jgi:hypothetical protein